MQIKDTCLELPVFCALVESKNLRVSAQLQVNHFKNDLKHASDMKQTYCFVSLLSFPSFLSFFLFFLLFLVPNYSSPPPSSVLPFSLPNSAEMHGPFHTRHDLIHYYSQYICSLCSPPSIFVQPTVPLVSLHLPLVFHFTLFLYTF